MRRIARTQDCLSTSASQSTRSDFREAPRRLCCLRVARYEGVPHCFAREVFMLTRRSVLIAAAGAGVAVISPALATGPQPFDDAAFAAAQKAGKPIFVAIHATWCPICKAQKPILSELMGDAKFANLTYFTIDFDSQKDLVRRFGAQ